MTTTELKSLVENINSGKVKLHLEMDSPSAYSQVRVSTKLIDANDNNGRAQWLLGWVDVDDEIETFKDIEYVK